MPKSIVALCSCCEKPEPGYDRLPGKRVQLVPLWGFQVFFNYAMTKGSRNASESSQVATQLFQSKKEIQLWYR